MIPSAFEYHAPTSLPDAIALLGRYGDEARLLAGGHSLLPMMKLRFAAPAHLVDLGRIPDLRGIAQVGGEIHIGAMTTEHELLTSKLLAEKLPLLVEAASLIGDPQVHAANYPVWVRRIPACGPGGHRLSAVERHVPCLPAAGAAGRGRSCALRR